MSKAPANNIDAVITAMDRPLCLRSLLESIPPDAFRSIYIGDQSEYDGIFPDHTNADAHTYHIYLPYDSGLSFTRNILVNMDERDARSFCMTGDITATETPEPAPYVLLLEDDFLFTEETQIQYMATLLDAFPDAGVVGGMVKQNETPIHFEFVPEIHDGVLYHTPDGDAYTTYAGIRYKQTGCVLNFALFRREVFKDIMWDADLKLREHQDFYLRFKETGWNVLYTPDVCIADAKPPHTPDYRALKNREEFQARMMEKHGIHKIVYQNGSTREYNDGNIVKRKEAPLV